MTSLTLPRRARSALGSAGQAIERAQGTPAWIVLPAMTGGASLVIAVLGLFWDVAYHIDHGRDVNLLTVPHLLILAGLLGLGGTALAAIALATVDGRGGWAVGPLRVPYFALPLSAMALGAGLGFPLDDLWHRTYGIDVTMWSPTHLLMIGGAAFSTFALALVPAEGALHGGRSLPRWRRVSLTGAMVVAVSVFTLEFDFGVPQWQALYHPLIVMTGLTLTLVAARASLGRGGALAATGFFLLFRVGLALLLAGPLGHTAPGFPAAIGIAACVELAFWATRGRAPMVTALAAGLLAATGGLASEWAWQALAGRLPWHAGLLALAWVPMAGAILGAVVGMAAGRIQAGERSGLPVPAVLGALAGLALLLLVPLPRTAAPDRVHLSTVPAGAPRPGLDRAGVPATIQDVWVDVSVDGREAEGADWFMVMAWQGGGEHDVRLDRVGPGHYRAEQPVPTGGSWKATVFLARGATLEAVPVSFPPDPENRFAGYPLEPQRDTRFVPAAQILMTETHGGPAWVAVAGYAALLGTVLAWLVTLVIAHRAVSRARGARSMEG